MKKMQECEGERDWDRWRQLKILLDQAYKCKEEYWSKKFRANWLKEEDKNTKFFHAVTAERRKRNRMEMLQKEDRTECRDETRLQMKWLGTLVVYLPLIIH